MCVLTGERRTVPEVAEFQGQAAKRQTCHTEEEAGLAARTHPGQRRAALSAAGARATTPS